MPDEKSEFQHNVFISWSGNRSKHVASALHDWLPIVLQAAKPWTSGTDIDKGSRGLTELAKALENIKVGIICLTPENLSEKWILFESGALSKTLDPSTRVCTYLLGGLRPQDVTPPLGEFQATKAEKEDTRRLMQTLNKGLGSPVADAHLNASFDALWPKLKEVLDSMPKPEADVPPKRSLDDMVAEILEISRTEVMKREQAEAWQAQKYIFTTLPETLPEPKEGFISRVLPDGNPINVANLMRVGDHPVVSGVKYSGLKPYRKEKDKK
jgi:hypothetical protein